MRSRVRCSSSTIPTPKPRMRARVVADGGGLAQRVDVVANHPVGQSRIDSPSSQVTSRSRHDLGGRLCSARRPSPLAARRALGGRSSRSSPAQLGLSGRQSRSSASSCSVFVPSARASRRVKAPAAGDGVRQRATGRGRHGGGGRGLLAAVIGWMFGRAAHSGAAQSPERSAQPVAREHGARRRTRRSIRCSRVLPDRDARRRAGRRPGP